MEEKESEERLLTITEVKEILKEREEAGIELGYVQTKAYDYVRKFSILSNEDTKKLLDILKSKYNIEDKLATQIVNLQYQFPETVEEIDLMFDKSDMRLDEAQKLDLIELLKEYTEIAKMK